MTKFRQKLGIWAVIPCLMFNSVFFTSCDDETIETVTDIITEILNIFGYNPETEDVDDQETADDLSDEVTETKVNWENKFPPIGNQGSYGTCVAWATAYNLQTALNVMSGRWSTPSSTSNQCSPVDLWHLMPTSGKSTSCNGSNFDPAFETLISKGCATMAQVPFTNSKMTCDGVSGKGSTNKLGQYRIVAYSAEMSSTGKAYGMTVDNIKAYLQKGPVVVGAKLGDRFMSWNSSNVITSDNDTYNGQHAYHAMAVVGYDDSKKAFRLRNSWGPDDWGDEGSIWVGYDFFVSQFAFGVWTASNSTSTSSTKSASAVSGPDVAVFVKDDVNNGDGTRTVTYTLKNDSKTTIEAGKYTVAYVLFKAKHFANHYFVMETTNETALTAGSEATYTYTYAIPENMPDGKYYLALIADPFDEQGDGNRSNNFSFVTAESVEPFFITGNQIAGLPQTIANNRTLVSSYNPNAYRNREIENALIREHNRK